MSKEAMVKGYKVGDSSHRPYLSRVDISGFKDNIKAAKVALTSAERTANAATKRREALEEVGKAEKDLVILNRNRRDVERLSPLLESLNSELQTVLSIARDRDKKALALKEVAKEDRVAIQTGLDASNTLLKDALKPLREEISKATGKAERASLLSSMGIATDEKALLEKAATLSSKIEAELLSAKTAVESIKAPEALQALAATANPDALESSKVEERSAKAALKNIQDFNKYFNAAELLIKTRTFDFGAENFAKNFADSTYPMIKADANYNLGAFAQRDGDQTKAIAYYQIAHEAGSKKAAYALGAIYEHNDNLPEALKWYKEAAKEDNKDKTLQADAALRTGKLLAKDSDHSNAVKYFQIAANDSPEAAFELALCYQDGLGVEQNQSEAVKYYTQAVRAGHGGAANNLAACYEYGLGVEQNLAKAMDLYKSAGFEIISDNKRRLQSKLDDLALENTDPHKQYELARDFEERALVSRNTGIGDGDKLEKNAFILYQKSAEAGNPDAIYKTANCYNIGLGVERDSDKAIKLYEQVKEDQSLEYKNANYALGKIYQKDKKDDKTAAQHFKVAADLGDPLASFELARYYKTGGVEGFEQNNKEAARLYQFAVDMVGHKQAKAELDKLPHDSYALANIYKVRADKLADDDPTKEVTYQKAVELYQYAIDKANHPLAAYNLGKMCLEGLVDGKHEKAAAKYFEIAADPDAPGQTPANLEAARKELASSIRKGAVENKGERDAVELERKPSDPKSLRPSEDEGEEDTKYKKIVRWHNGIIQAAHDQCDGRGVAEKQKIIAGVLTQAITDLWRPILPGYKVPADVQRKIEQFSEKMAKDSDGILSFKRKGEGEGLRKFKKFGNRIGVVLGVAARDASVSDFLKHQYNDFALADDLARSSVLGPASALAAPTAHIVVAKGLKK